MATEEAPENIRRKISALLERAAHPNTPENERVACREKADVLMTQHRIQRATFNWEKPIESRRKPTYREFEPIRLVSHTINSKRDFVEYEIEERIKRIRTSCFRFAGVRQRGRWDSEKEMWMTIVVGYDEDILYGEELWLSSFSEALRLMYPGWSDQRSFDDNVYGLKEAGYSWPVIREIGIANNGGDAYGKLTEKNAASKLRTAYKRARKARGLSPELPKQKDPQHWRNSFATSFCVRLEQRMAAMKAGREEYITKDNLPALQKDEDAVNSLFDELFPPPPEPTEEELAQMMRDIEEGAKRNKGRKAPKKRSRPPREADVHAWNAGYFAADNVSLGRTEKISGNGKELN